MGGVLAPFRRALHAPQSTARVRQRREAVCGLWKHERRAEAAVRHCPGPTTGRHRAHFTIWETGLDNPEHLKGSITWLSAASTSAGPRASTPAPPPSSSEPPRPQASR
ncbi:hypothetical protein DN051_11295 [Streptomyces cadmiisoli]|uniref:Uncharacterized protein n=1 Tax=Streptomyces cadmiisoli TaxID=2184053 RepID=A0A2Z4IWI6_9ACTN|nr:hypothetical protein DN051_11295 [Streptomyces cadmiisoli]